MAEQYFARFKIIGEIGIGGMGLVYQAHDPLAERNVAIKVLPPEYIHDLGLRANFEREARLISSLEHESIVPVLEYGAFEGQPYLVMPYMPNGSLADRLVQGPLTPLETMHVLERLASALDYTHQQHIVHSDLKPSNILFGEDGQAFLADFGIALQNREAWSGTGVVRGSPAYLSPEQALRTESIDGRSDVYSLGIIVFEMLTGDKPFRGDAPMVVVLKQIHDEPPLLRSVDPNIPPALEEVVLRALAKDARDRYQTAGDFAAAFNHSLSVSQAPSLASDSELAQEATAVSGLAALPLQSKPPHHGVAAPAQVGEDLVTKKGPAHEQLPGWNWTYLLALGLVLWAGLVFGVASAALVRHAQASAPPNLQLVIDQAGITVTNVSRAPVNLSGLSFRHLSDTGDVLAEFQASQWERLPEPGKGVLPAGACYQLLDRSSGSLDLTTGTPQPRPHDCQNLLGWLAVEQPGWKFWSPQGGATIFQVLQDGKTLKTCPVQAGQCDFYLAQP
jgi:hypothetical protein